GNSFYAHRLALSFCNCVVCVNKMNTHGFGTNILVLDGKNWDRWNALMKSFFGAQDCLDVVLNGNDELVENPTEAQKL
ncbi:F-box protein, partial [Trifolium pratense]